ncbi:glycosyltransferase [Streptomyces sp. NPDC048845]|uniref:glycosyltransferase n=1 Tax=Streptomyces sp. NPDC048845 TaxID=3155390 RepID=UPI003425573A
MPAEAPAPSRRTRVGFHAFRTYTRHPGKDGANFAYTELGRLLRGSDAVDPRPHDVVELCRSDAVARETLAGCDVVVATAGPHAYLYFHLRERLGLRFRIVRDVRTALWNGYLQQEALAAPYLRGGDVLYHSSRYSLALFSALFPHLAGTAQTVCYPLLHWFPPELENSWTGSRGPVRRPGARRTRRIGFVGRLTDDKNHAQALDLLAELNRRAPGRFELHAVGEGSPPRRGPGAPGGPDLPGYRWTPPIDRARLWEHYRTFDTLFFPSTSSLETFGRVLVEASYIGTPVLASAHAATSELLPAQALVPTAYRTDREFTTHFAARLGDVDTGHAADLLESGEAPPRAEGHRSYARHDRLLLSLVLDGPGADTGAGAEPTGVQRDFISRIRTAGLRSVPGPAQADALISRIRGPFVALHERGRPGYFATLATLLARSRHRGKTVSFLRKSLLHGEDLSNIGGIDLQLSHLIGHEPRFRIAAARTAVPGDDRERETPCSTN